DPSDKGPSAFAFFQLARTPDHQSAFFVIENQCFAVRQGLTAVVDAAKVAHGMWAPRDCQWPFIGCAFVRKQ
ncbi:unnamed protein product, partial [Prorocentrum cordatum]